MANTYALPQQTTEPVQETQSLPLEQQQLPISSLTAAPQRLSLSPPLARLPVELDIAVPIREFRVRNLVGLQPGQIVETQWEDTGDLPLAAGDVQLAWCEFEVVETRMAVRITRLI